MTKRPGLFVTFEGGDGAGKTTLIRRVEESLAQEGISAICTREPGGTLLSEEIRKWLLAPFHNMAPDAELALFLAARAQHIHELIAPALQQQKVVLCDRFNDSTVAYQGIGRGLGWERVQQLCLLFCGDVLPHLTFYLDLDPVVGLERVRKHQSDFLDRIESEALAYHERVRQGFLQIAAREPSRIHVINAAQPAYEVYEAVYGQLKKIMYGNESHCWE